MKKRLISLLLTVCMVTVLFAGLSTTAAAADDKVSGYLVSYTLQAGYRRKRGHGKKWSL